MLLVPFNISIILTCVMFSLPIVSPDKIAGLRVVIFIQESLCSEFPENAKEENA